jgi:hypothetical protein
MISILSLVQVSIALSVAYVWIFRFHNVEKEFQLFGLSITTRSFVGVSKIALSTLLVTGVWFADLIFVPAVLMAFFMVAAQYFHFKVKNPFMKHLPSLILLALCLVLIFGTTAV